VENREVTIALAAGDHDHAAMPLNHFSQQAIMLM
jgi:hypothetical protein